MTASTDREWLEAAIALSERSRGTTAPNPNVGCLIISAQGHVVGRGWTRAGGRPHAEALALEQAAARAGGGTAYVSLEPCAHDSARGPCCTNLLISAGVARVVVAMTDPDARTNGQGIARLRNAGIVVDLLPRSDSARSAMGGFLMRQSHRRPYVTLKLATSLDGCIALADGSSQWITGPAARAHGHVERARSELILVGRGTFLHDHPRLDVRLPGLAQRSPRRCLLSRGSTPEGWLSISKPSEIAGLPGDHLLIEGGAATASAFLEEDLVDRMLLYRAPILIGGGKACLADLGLSDLSDAHGRWRLVDARRLGADGLEVYERTRSG